MIPSYKIEFNEKEQKDFKLSLQDTSSLVEEAVQLYISFNLRMPKKDGWNPPLTIVELENLVNKALNEFIEQRKLIEKDGIYTWYTEKLEQEDDVLG
jgi:hypothetical protein